eukprot:Protomagalhaensia_wolfi_Nauph_80__1993@NODE_2260_length_1146_cov_7_777778_g1765_i0_p1_GENE_NODE_2260_length_1146_cov_7_777778_g1765_i0NODE_2260_length_1146_cov_7_777778_g1765_i0_p1_ORF_typecomplete_len358_score58_39GHMP_kinases_N/PF00288_26/5_4e13GHMP_kinases_N/PF00288_26/8_5e03GHMP_kinases_C/PF08544_13/4_6e03GHMP_kinases_C/PF08544_13/0_0041zfRING_11/PF17123_5/10zfRING_11/PF17123_5/3_4e02zfRING_2/PF13639_6/9e02zfRING_2/PF13639_6/12zfRING_2/PF13639_6/2_2e02_NODE_2260_length_1146_cov_7_777778_g176
MSETLSTTSSSHNGCRTLLKLGDSVVVRAPATSANLGCGFDTFGLAFDLWLTVSVRVSSTFHYCHSGCTDNELPLDATNTVVTSFHTGLKHLQQTVPCDHHFHFSTHSQIPVARGLGSSAAAIVAGLAAAFALAGRSLEAPETLEAIARLASAEEGHPDNVLPAVYGGLQIGVLRRQGLDQVAGFQPLNGAFIRQPVPWPITDVACLVYIPSVKFSTKTARAILPTTYERSLVAQNIGRAALFVAALLCKEYDNLKFGVEDQLHQPFRTPHCPSFSQLKQVSPLTNALAVYLSGAGPSTVILVRTTEAHNLRPDLERLCPHLFHPEQGRLQPIQVTHSGVHLLSQCFTK